MSNLQVEQGLLIRPVDDVIKESILLSKNFFGPPTVNDPLESISHLKLRLQSKINDEYRIAHARAQTNRELAEKKEQAGGEPDWAKDIETITTNLQNPVVNKEKPDANKKKAVPQQKVPQKIVEETEISNESFAPKSEIENLIEELPKSVEDKLSKIPKKFLIFNKSDKEEQKADSSSALVLHKVETQGGQIIPVEGPRLGTINLSKIRKLVKPQWHAPWKLMRVISGHDGWVRCLAVDPSNQFFVTGSNDRTIKFWDLATGKLKITLTGHISAVRGLAISSRHAYMYSCGEDKKVFCWDLEANKIVRNYHGHLSGIYTLSLHPELDILATGGRDSVVRLWDCRTKTQIHVLSGHQHAVSSIATQEHEPQLISGSHDHMVKLWDIGTGKCMETLTNHKKAIRSLAIHPNEYTFASGGADNIKVWKCPEGEFTRNFSGHNAMINALAINQDNVMVSGGDNGSLYFWDWTSGYNFQQMQSIPQPGSISSEGGIFAASFDRSGMRLITAECDKSIKMWREDDQATEETHPIDLNWKANFR